jgi:uncharacterized SAM-binding protein YcdF (DUF218 family)
VQRRREGLGAVRRRALGAVVPLVVALALAWLFRSTLLPPVGRFLHDADPNPSGFVLGGGRSTRADLAADLHRRGAVRRILVAGAGGVADVDGVRLLSEQEILVRMLRALGVPDEAVERLPDVAQSTEEEAAALRRRLQRRPASSVVVITTDCHTRRCRWIFSRALAGTPVRVQIAGAPGEAARPEDWWKTPEGRRSYGLEAIKLLPAWFRSLW